MKKIHLGIQSLTLFLFALISTLPLNAQSFEDKLTDGEKARVIRWKQECRTLLQSDTALAFRRAKSYIDSAGTDSPVLKGEAYMNLAVLHIMSEKSKLGLRPLRRAIDEYQKENDSIRIGYAYRNIGLAQNNLLRPDSALDNYYLSLTYIDSNRSTHFYALSSYEMARTLFGLQTYDYSEIYYRRASRLFILDGRLREAANSLYELSYLLVRQGRDEFLPFAERALRLAVQEGDSLLAGRIEAINARYLLDNNNPDEAWNHLKRTQNIFRSNYEPFFMLIIDQLIAEYYLQKGDLDLAEFRAEEALKALDAQGFNEYDAGYLREELYKTLFTVYYQTKNYSKALAFAQAYKETAEKLVQRSETNKLRFMEREVESIKRRQELERTQIQLEFSQENEALLRRQVLGFTIGGFLLLVLLGWIIVANRKINKSRAELREQKEFIEEQHRELEQLNADKDQLFAIIGHDLRGPVGNLSNLLTFIPAEGDVISDESQEILDIAQQGLIESLDLLENLLIWAKEQKEDFSLKTELQEIKPYIESIETLYAPLIKQRNIKFEYLLEEKATACFDRNTFKTVVRNIVSNGIKYIPEGSIIRYTAEQKGDMLRLVIEDNGKGIPQEIMNALSVQEDGNHRVLKKKDKGDLGLGLRMSRDFIRANGGEMLIIANGPLGGACFDITLPLTCG